MLNKITNTSILIILFITIFVLLGNVEVRAQKESKGVRTLYLIRHGEYTPQDDNIPDSENVLLAF